MERGLRESHMELNMHCERVRAAEHAPRDPFCVSERFHGLAEIVERGAVVLAERLRVGGSTAGELALLRENS